MTFLQNLGSFVDMSPWRFNMRLDLSLIDNSNVLWSNAIPSQSVGSCEGLWFAQMLPPRVESTAWQTRAR